MLDSAFHSGPCRITPNIDMPVTFGTPGEPVSGTREIAPGTVATGLEAHVAEGGTLVLTNGDVTLNAPSAARC